MRERSAGVSESSRGVLGRALLVISLSGAALLLTPAALGHPARADLVATPLPVPTGPLPPTLPAPTSLPTEAPSILPTVLPSILPTILPTVLPTVLPSELPTAVPSVSPSALPSGTPSPAPSAGGGGTTSSPRPTVTPGRSPVGAGSGGSGTGSSGDPAILVGTSAAPVATEPPPLTTTFLGPIPSQLPVLPVVLPLVGGLLLLAASAGIAAYSRTREARRLRALEQAKSEFMKLASHELRTPLTVVRGYVSMIRDGTLKPPSKGYAEALPILDERLAQIETLVDHMLLAARLEEGPEHLQLEYLDLREIVEEAVGSVQPRAGSTHTLRLVTPAEAVTVNADRVRLHGAVEQLLDNAIKYSPAGGEVVCRVARLDGHAVVEVTDHGIGIAAADLPRLFTRFGRFVTPENSQILGSGLGLYLSRELTRLQGGDIEARSREGEGSTFTLRLPAAIAG